MYVYAMKVYMGSRGGTRWRWVVNFTPRPIYTHGKNRGTHRTGGWVCLVDRLVKRKISCPYRDWNPGPSTSYFLIIVKCDYDYRYMVQSEITHPPF